MSTKGGFVEILRFTHFVRVFKFIRNTAIGRKTVTNNPMADDIYEKLLQTLQSAPKIFIFTKNHDTQVS